MTPYVWIIDIESNKRSFSNTCVGILGILFHCDVYVFHAFECSGEAEERYNHVQRGAITCHDLLSIYPSHNMIKKSF